MNPLTKRFVLVFSLCLNAGFILMAGYLLFTKPDHVGIMHKKGRESIMRALDRTAPTPEIRAELGKKIDAFGNDMHEINREIWATRAAIMRFFSQADVADQEKLDALLARLGQLQSRRTQRGVEHFKELRALLGNEKGAVFFGALADELDHR